MFLITYDQIPAEEESESFDTLNCVIEFSIEMLNGNYSHDMNKEELTRELEKNGYYPSTMRMVLLAFLIGTLPMSLQAQRRPGLPPGQGFPDQARRGGLQTQLPEGAGTYPTGDIFIQNLDAIWTATGRVLENASILIQDAGDDLTVSCFRHTGGQRSYVGLDPLVIRGAKRGGRLSDNIKRPINGKYQYVIARNISSGTGHLDRLRDVPLRAIRRRDQNDK